MTEKVTEKVAERLGVEDSEEQGVSVRAKRKAEIPLGDMHKTFNKRGKNKPKGTQKTLSDKRIGSVKLKEFVNKLIRDDYVDLESDLKNIVCTKIAERVDEEIKVLRSEEK